MKFLCNTNIKTYIAMEIPVQFEQVKIRDDTNQKTTLKKGKPKGHDQYIENQN